MKVLVGCPIYMRAWALPRWLDAVADQAKNPDFDIELGFVVTPGPDSTEKIITQEKKKDRFRQVHIRHFEENPFEGEHRCWNRRSRLEVLTRKRNDLLALARETDAEIFFSLDSDVIINDGFAELLRKFTVGAAKDFDAISPVARLAENLFNASVLRGSNHYTRIFSLGTGILEADALMVAVAMKRALFMDPRVKYFLFDREKDYWEYWGPSGNPFLLIPFSEDYGWSRCVRDLGYRMVLDQDIEFKHIQHPAKVSHGF